MFSFYWPYFDLLKYLVDILSLLNLLHLFLNHPVYATNCHLKNKNNSPAHSQTSQLATEANFNFLYGLPPLAKNSLEKHLCALFIIMKCFKFRLLRQIFAVNPSFPLRWTYIISTFADRFGPLVPLSEYAIRLCLPPQFVFEK